MNVKTARFYENEEKALAFVDAHWDRVMEFGYDDKANGGWFVNYSIVPAVAGNNPVSRSKAR